MVRATPRVRIHSICNHIVIKIGNYVGVLEVEKSGDVITSARVTPHNSLERRE